LAAEIKEERGIDAILLKGSGGQFEIVLDGRLLFSKKQEGRFPDSDEILSKIPATRSGAS
jgi:selenoprotein W-related protein